MPCRHIFRYNFKRGKYELKICLDDNIKINEKHLKISVIFITLKYFYYQLQRPTI